MPGNVLLMIELIFVLPKPRCVPFCIYGVHGPESGGVALVLDVISIILLLAIPFIISSLIQLAVFLTLAFIT